MTREEAESRLADDPGDLAAGIALYNAAIAAGRGDQALETLRAMSANPDCPPYVHYLEGQLLEKQHQIEEAWKQFDQCPH
jgi:Flp pilus assembly protein TadD